MISNINLDLLAFICRWLCQFRFIIDNAEREEKNAFIRRDDRFLLFPILTNKLNYGTLYKTTGWVAVRVFMLRMLNNNSYEIRLSSAMSLHARSLNLTKRRGQCFGSRCSTKNTLDFMVCLSDNGSSLPSDETDVFETKEQQRTTTSRGILVRNND